MTKKDIFLLPYFLMIIAGLIIPSDGNHGFFTVKSLSFLASGLFLIGYALSCRKYTISQFQTLLFFLLGALLSLIWLSIGYIRDLSPDIAMFDQFKIFIITITIPVTTLFLIQGGMVAPARFFKVVFYATFFYSFLKVVLVGLHMCKVLDIWGAMEAIGFRYMRMKIVGGLERVQTSVDIVTPFVVFFVLQSKQLGIDISNRFKKSFLFFGMISTFLSFSRYLIFIYFVSCFLYWFTLNFTRMTKIAFWFACALLLGVWAVGAESIWNIVERRLFSADNYYSDQARTLQVNALMHEFWFYPFFGKGLGGYAESYVRDRVLLHSYEVQWVAFLMQFGIVGLAGLLAPCLLLIFAILRGSFTRLKLAFSGMFLLWLFSGFTNPFLISLTSGIIYTLFWLSARKINEGILSEKSHLSYDDGVSCLNSSVGRAAHS